ncbi:hypothetical protein GCM10023167_09300 [Brevibacterium pityocampae]|uniref:Phosphotyrosine protein phosphatase I domain-containing protein n=1 Tax=Brevibacterium pityocampae TaxID=506594 RepID=A0ABP8J7H9_9MICO
MLRTAAEDSGMRVVTVPVNAAEQPLPGSGIAILAAALRVVGDGTLAARIEDLDLDEAEVPVAAETFMTAVRTDGGTGDLLLVIDDADVLDPLTQSFLGFVLRRLTGGRVRFAVSVAALDPDGPFGGTTTIDLQRLDPAESMRAAFEISPGLDPAAARLVATGAVGHLLTLEQVIGTLGERQRIRRASLPHPLRSTEAMDAFASAKLHGLSEEALTILRTLAVAPRSSFLPLLAGYATMGEELAELEARDLVSRVGSHLRIRDPRIRSSIHGAMSAGERAALHVQMMRACEDADPALSLWHSTFAGHREDAAHRLIAHACALVDEGTRRGWSRRRRSRSSRCAPGTSAARRWPRRSCSRGSTALCRFAVRSAGTHARAGDRATPQVIEIARRLGVSLTEFRARRLSAEQIRSADLILAMDRSHRAAVVEIVPQALHRTFTLREFARTLPQVPAERGASADARWRSSVVLVGRRRSRAAGDPAADDIVDPFLRSDAVHREMTGQLVPATGALLQCEVSAAAAERDPPPGGADPGNRPGR